MRRSSIVGILVIALMGCQTTRQSIACTIVGVGVAGLGALGMYGARNDDEGAPLIFPLAIVAGGLTALVSLLSLAGDDDPAPSRPPVAPPVQLH